jgi:hypothetical protein
MEETKNQLIQTGFTLDRLHQDGKIDDEAYTILKDRNKQAINYSQCCTQLNAGFKIGDKVVSINGRVAEIIGFPKHGHARVRNDVGGGIWQPNITELKLHKSV